MKLSALFISFLLLPAMVVTTEAQQRAGAHGVDASAMQELAFIYDGSLNLTEAQMEEIAKIRTAYRMEMRSSRAEQRNRGREMRATRMPARTEMMEQIREVLTPEQQRELAEMQQQRSNQREAMQNHMTAAWVEIVAEDIGLDDEKTQAVTEIVKEHRSEMRLQRERSRDAVQNGDRRERLTARAENRDQLMEQVREVLSEEEFELWQKQWNEMMPARELRRERPSGQRRNR